MQGCSPSSPAGPRLWRPAAQRNLKNSWSSIVMQLHAWSSASSLGLSAATSLVNALLSSRYVEFMNFGVLKAMHDIEQKARDKLFHQGESSSMEMLASFKSLVESLSIMQQAKETMRTYLKVPSTGPVVEFSHQQHIDMESGDGDALPVFSALAVQTHEMLAQELIDMFVEEIKIKWVIILELHLLLYSGLGDRHPKKAESKMLLYDLHAEAALKLPAVFDGKLGCDAIVSAQRGSDTNFKQECLQVYLTAWLAEVNIRRQRKEEILKLVTEEVQLAIQV